MKEVQRQALRKLFSRFRDDFCTLFDVQIEVRDETTFAVKLYGTKIVVHLSEETSQ